MVKRRIAPLTVLLCAALLFGCEAPTEPVPATSDAVTLDKGGPVAQATGGGQYTLTVLEAAFGVTFPGKFSFGATQFANGRANGQLRYTLDLGDGINGVLAGGVIDFHGRVTCVSVDLANGRAWIGGVITQNKSTQPFYRDDATTQVGKDIWFRVLDTGEGQSPPDRTTFVGFEGNAGIITSQEYCDAQIWPDDNARTNPVSQGNIQVHD